MKREVFLGNFRKQNGLGSFKLMVFSSFCRVKGYHSNFITNALLQNLCEEYLGGSELEAWNELSRMEAHVFGRLIEKNR